MSGAVKTLIGFYQKRANLRSRNRINFGKENATPVSVYLVADHLLTGFGVPAMICGMQNSSVKIAIEEPTNQKSHGSLSLVE